MAEPALVRNIPPTRSQVESETAQAEPAVETPAAPVVVETPVAPAPAPSPASAPEAPAEPEASTEAPVTFSRDELFGDLLDPVEEEREEDQREYTPAATGTLTLSRDDVLSEQQRVITGTQQIAYYTFFLDAVAFLLAGGFFFLKALKQKAKVRYKPMMAFGGLLCWLGGSFFVLSWFYQDFLNHGGVPTIAPRAFMWAVLAPLMFGIFSMLVKVHKGDQMQYTLMFVMSSLIFCFIGLSHLPMLPESVQLGLAVVPFLCSATLSFLLFTTLGALSDSMTGKLKQGFNIVIFTIIGGWFLYPTLNLAAHLLPDEGLARLLLNLVDLALMTAITIGIYESVSNKQGHIHIKPAFSKATAVVEGMVSEGSEGERPAGPKPPASTPPGAPKAAPPKAAPPKAAPPKPKAAPPKGPSQ